MLRLLILLGLLGWVLTALLGWVPLRSSERADAGHHLLPFFAAGLGWGLAWGLGLTTRFATGLGCGLGCGLG